jgi:hypothetical protein
MIDTDRTLSNLLNSCAARIGLNVCGADAASGLQAIVSPRARTGWSRAFGSFEI